MRNRTEEDIREERKHKGGQAMNKEQEEAIEQLKTLQGDIETVLSMLQEQQEENKKKDKIINEMARFITNKDIDEDICRYQVVEHYKNEEYGVTTDVCINCIKQYFERKVKEWRIE
jgi:hypothetical protein